MGEPLSVAPYLVEAYLAVGRRADVVAVAEQFEAVTPASGPAVAASAGGTVSRGSVPDGDEAAEQAFEAALAAHADAPDTFDPARSHLLYGARLRRSGQRVKARERVAHRSRRIRGDGPYGLDASWASRRTCHHRGQAAHPPTTADRAAHLSRDASSAARGQGHVKQGDCRGPVPQPEDGRASSQPRLPEAGFPLPRGARRVVQGWLNPWRVVDSVTIPIVR